jgi:hypothetical protein
MDHIWSVDLVNDGKHKSITMLAEDDVTPFTTPVANTLTGSTSGGLFDLSQEWDTLGDGHAFMMDIINTNSGAGSDLMNLKVNGVTVFRIGMDGLISVGGGGGGGGGGDVSAPSGNFSGDNQIIRSDGAAKSIQGSAVHIDDAGNMADIAVLQYGYSQVMSVNAKSLTTVYQAPSDGFVLVQCNATTGNWQGYAEVRVQSVNPPVTVRAKTYVGANTTDRASTICCPVKKGEYWRVILTISQGTPYVDINWFPLGLLGA